MMGYIFDLDGTLLDSMHAWDDIVERYLETIGIPTKESFKKEFEIMSLREAAQFLKQKFVIHQSVEEIVTGIIACLKQKYAKELKLKVGVREFLEVCKQKEIKMCVLTANDQELANLALTNNGIRASFDYVLSCEELKLSKTSTDSFLHASKSLEMKVEDCVVIEDALHAIKCAKEAGFYVIAIYDEANKKDWKKICEIADESYQSFIEMENIK